MLTKTSIKKPFTVIVMIIVIAIVGGVAVAKMPLDLFPEMDLPYMIVATMVPGGAPEEIETKVTKPMEAQMRQINNVKEVQSISADNVSAVIMELNMGTDLTTMTQDIDTKIKSIRASFPDMTMEPIVMKIDPDMMPIMTVAISKAGQTIEQSSPELENLSKKIQSVGGVASVSTTGQIENNVFMQIDPMKILNDPSNMLANHLSEYINNPLKPMPKKMVDLINSNDSIKEIFEIIKNNPHGLPEWIANTDNKEVKLLLSLVGNMTNKIPVETKNMISDMMASRLTPSIITQLLFANNFEMPAGTTPLNGMDYFIKIGEKVGAYEEFKHLPAISLDLRSFEIPEEVPNPKFDESEPESDKNPKTITVNVKVTDMISKMFAGAIKPEMTEGDFDTLVKDLPVLIKGTVKDMVKEYMYDLDSESGKYIRDRGMYEYLLGIFYQPMTVELTDFAHMFNTNTASKSHTIINGAEGMMLSIYKTPDASVTSVTNGISKLLKQHAADEGINYIVLSNQGEVTKFMLSSIAQNLLLGALFAIIVLLIFLRDWKPTVTVGMSIIVSLVTAFAVMYLCGVTLNLVSMGGLALSVGMLVDNSIVVIENIYRKRNEGVSAIKAAYEGTKQVSGAILSSTITTVIVFVPVIFVEGITKQIFTDLAITIAVSLFASLLVAITLVPMVSSRMLNIGKAAKKESKLFVKMKQSYAKSLNFMLNKKWITLVIVSVLFIASIVSVFFMDVEFLPNTTMEQIIVTAGIDKTQIDEDKYAYDEIVDDVINDINTEFRKKEYIKDMGVELSAGMTVMGFTMGGGNITAYVTLDKKAKIKPAKAQEELETIVTDIADKYPENAVVLGGIKNTGGVDVAGMVNSYMDASLMTVNVYGSSIDEMRNAARDLEKQFAEIGDDVKINNGLVNETKEFKLIVDKNKASKYNLTTATIFMTFFQNTVPPTANTNINFINDIGSSDIFIYTTDNNMTRWYRAKDESGDSHRMYFFMDDETAKATKFEERLSVIDGVTRETIEYTLDRETGTFTSTEKKSYDENGKLIAKSAYKGVTLSANPNDMPVYYDTSKIRDVDMITESINVPTTEELENMMNAPMPFASEQTNGDLVQKRSIPMFMLLDSASFERDMATNKIIYRNINTNPEYQGMIDNKLYYTDTNGNIRYNYSGDDVMSVLKNLSPAIDTNPMVPKAINMVYGFNTITHMEGRRVVQMGLKSASLSNKQLEREAKKIIKTFNESNAYRDIQVDFVGQNRMIADTFNSLILIVILAVIFIYLVMVAQFQSLKSPFIIMFTIPLALTGSILTLLMAQLPISVFALVGIILLVGIVVNNGIVFVDYVNKLMQSGMPKREALLRTAQDRIRPILMTALTTICSMLISVFDTSMGAAAIKPMAVTVVGGLSYATLLTLFFVPILYDLFNRKEKLAVIKFEDDKEDDIEAEMRLSSLNDVKEVLEESKSLEMMDESFIANNMSTNDNVEDVIADVTGAGDSTEEVTANDGTDDVQDVDAETARNDDMNVDDVGEEVNNDVNEAMSDDARSGDEDAAVNAEVNGEETPKTEPATDTLEGDAPSAEEVTSEEPSDASEDDDNKSDNE